MKRFTHFRLPYGIIVCLVFLGFFIPAANAEDITLAWDKPEGTVVGYNIYYGKMGTEFKAAPKIKVSNGDQTSCDITGLDQGELYGFVATSVDDKGKESVFSEELYHNIPAKGEELLDDEWTDNDELDGADGAKGASGGGEASPPDAPLMGIGDLADTYFAVNVSDNGAFGTALLKVTFDGAGALSHEQLNKSEDADTGIGSTYTVDANGGLAIEGVDKGAVSPDGGYFACGKMSSDASPMMLFGIRQAKGLKAADLKGEYKLFLFSSTPDPATGAPVATTATGSMTADGQGNIAKAKGGSFDATYTVDPETGRLTMAPAARYSQMNGALSKDGTVFAAVDTSADDNSLVFVIGFKAAAKFSAADLSGKYFVNQFEYDETLQMPVGSLSKLSVTGNGGYNLEQIANSCDCPPDTSSGVLVAGEKGEIEAVDDATQESVSGGLSSGGEVFTVMKENALGIGIRQASAAPGSVASGGGGGGGGGSCFIASLF